VLALAVVTNHQFKAQWQANELPTKNSEEPFLIFDCRIEDYGCPGGLLPQSQDILYQPLGVSHVWSRAKAQTFTSETVTTLAAHPPDLHNENRFFKSDGQPSDGAVLRSLNELCLLGLTAGTNRQRRRADNVIKLSLILADRLFIVESTDALSMVNNAGCHSFGGLMSKTRQQNDSQHLLNPLNHSNHRTHRRL